ncbi:hypothetical protein CAL14_08610 [Bordetella genomosp. 9]|nr:hypothetical protein CAL14_08610 [Bordetella genomosp. 9]
MVRLGRNISVAATFGAQPKRLMNLLRLCDSVCGLFINERLLRLVVRFDAESEPSHQSIPDRSTDGFFLTVFDCGVAKLSD